MFSDPSFHTDISIIRNREISFASGNTAVYELSKVRGIMEILLVDVEQQCRVSRSTFSLFPWKEGRLPTNSHITVNHNLLLLETLLQDDPVPFPIFVVGRRDICGLLPYGYSPGCCSEDKSSKHSLIL